MSPPDLTIERFEAGRLDPEAFDHAAHVYVGWLYVCRYPLAEAVSRFEAAIRRLVKSLGDEDKYHTTLTWFYLLLIGERTQADEDWASFVARNPDLFDNRSLLARYYTSECLWSPRARAHFVLPDRIAV